MVCSPHRDNLSRRPSISYSSIPVDDHLCSQVSSGNDLPSVFVKDRESVDLCMSQTFGDQVRDMIVRSMVKDDSQDCDVVSRSALLASCSQRKAKAETNCLRESARLPKENNFVYVTPESSFLPVELSDDRSSPPVKRRLFDCPRERTAQPLSIEVKLVDQRRANVFRGVGNGFTCRQEASLFAEEHRQFEQCEDGLLVFADVASRMPTIPSTAGECRRQIIPVDTSIDKGQCV